MKNPGDSATPCVSLFLKCNSPWRGRYHARYMYTNSSNSSASALSETHCRPPRRPQLEKRGRCVPSAPRPPVQSARPASSDRPVPDRHQQGPSLARGRSDSSTQRAVGCVLVALTREVTLREGYARRTREATTRAPPTSNRNELASLRKGNLSYFGLSEKVPVCIQN